MSCCQTGVTCRRARNRALCGARWRGGDRRRARRPRADAGAPARRRPALTRLPGAGHPGRVADDPDQHSRPVAAPDRVGARAGLGQRLASRAAPSLQRPSRSELRSAPAADSGRAGHRVRCGSPAASPIAFSFAVARLAPTQPRARHPDAAAGKARPLRLAARACCRRRSRSATARRSGGDIFLTPLPSPEIHPESNNALTIHPVGPGGPMIIDGHGRLVWFPSSRHRSSRPTSARSDSGATRC